MPVSESTPSVTDRVRANAIEVAQCLLGALPRGLSHGDGYRRLRHRLSGQPARFETATRQPPNARDEPGTAPSWRGRKLVTAQSDLVIDGFPGSANSFLAHAVRSAIDRPAHVESHFHRTIQLSRALAYGVPTIVVVRSPRDACRSLKSKAPAMTDALIALRWLRYHRFVLRQGQRSSFHVVLFNDAIRDPDVLRRRCAALQRLAARPLVADMTVKRASTTHASFGGGPLTERILRRADHVYRAIESGLASGPSADGSSPRQEARTT